MSIDVRVACIAPYSGAESGCQDVPLPSRSIGTARSVAPFIVMSPMRPPPSCCMFIGAIVAAGAALAGAVVIPGIGAIVAAGAAVAGAIVIPGIGAIVAAAAGMPGIACIGSDAKAEPGGRITAKVAARMMALRGDDRAGLMTARSYHTPTRGVYPTRGAPQRSRSPALGSDTPTCIDKCQYSD